MQYTVRTTNDTCKMIFITEPETARIDVKSLGAKGDGISDDTYFVQMALDSCPKGGRVVLTKGTYLVRPIVLKNDITLELKKDAVLLGDTVEAHYPFVPAKVYIDGKEEVRGTWEGEPYDCHQSLVSGYKKKNVKIIGEGTIDGNAVNSTWWDIP